MAMPWKQGKQIAAALRGKGEFPEGYKGSRTVKALTALFDACFRIQREASEAAGRYVPMVVENVRGAQPWVGKARWNFGSFYLWGDVPALMPITIRAPKMGASPGKRFDERPASVAGHREHAGVKAGDRNKGKANGEHKWDSGFDAGLKLPGDNSARRWSERETQRLCDAAYKSQGMNWSDRSKRGQDFTRIAGEQSGLKLKDQDGYERNHDAAFGWKAPRTSSSSSKRKAAAAMIAKIPFVLSSWIAKVYFPC